MKTEVSKWLHVIYIAIKFGGTILEKGHHPSVHCYVTQGYHNRTHLLKYNYIIIILIKF